MKKKTTQAIASLCIVASLATTSALAADVNVGSTTSTTPTSVTTPTTPATPTTPTTPDKPSHGGGSGGGSSSTTGGSTTTTPSTNPSKSFSDVASSDYFYDAVQWAIKNGVTTGVSDTSFGPNQPCTRAQVITFLWRLAGSPKASAANPFNDVSASAYYFDAVQWAVENGITVGVSATSFAPDATITRGQAVTFMYRSNKSPAVTGSKSFKDVQPDAFDAKAINWAAETGVTVGTSADTFSPEAACTRAQIVTFLYRDNV